MSALLVVSDRRVAGSVGTVSYPPVAKASPPFTVCFDRGMISRSGRFWRRLGRHISSQER